MPPEPVTIPASRGSERAILFFTCSAHALTHVYMLIFPAVVDPMREAFSLSRTEFLGYATISTVLFGVGAIPSGWLSDRIGEKKMLIVFFLLTAVGGTVLGLASELAGLVCGMALVGLGTSVFHPVGNAMISRGLAAPGKAMGINGFWGSLGTAAGPILAVQVSELLSWRWAYMVLTLPMVALGFLLWRTPLESVDGPVSRDPPETGARRTDGRLDGPEPAGGSARSFASLRRGWAAMIIFLLAAMTCGGLYFHLITTMLPTHLAEQVTFSEAFRTGASAYVRGGYVTGVIYLIGGLGQIASGYLVHTREGRGLYIVALVAATPAIYLLSVLEDASLVLCASVMAVVIFSVQPIENILLARYAPAGMRGFLFGAKFILAFGVGGLGPGLSGYVSDGWSVSAVFVVASGFAALGAVFAVLARGMRPGRSPPRRWTSRAPRARM